MGSPVYREGNKNLRRQQRDEAAHVFAPIDTSATVKAQVEGQQQAIKRHYDDIEELKVRKQQYINQAAKVADPRERAGMMRETVNVDAQIRDIEKQISIRSRRIEVLRSGEGNVEGRNIELAREKASTLDTLETRSNPSSSIGYNTRLERVEVGRGDSRGTVVSKSDAEERGAYTKDATLDPRSEFTSQPPAGGGILSGGSATPNPEYADELKRSLVEGAVPQNPKKRIQSDEKHSLFLNPDFITGPREPPPNQTATRYKLVLTESMGGAGSYADKTGFENFMRQTESAGYTMVKVKGATAERIISLKDLRSELPKIQEDVSLSVWSRDPQRLKEKQAAIESKNELKAYLGQVRKQGYTMLKVTGTGTERVVAVSDAFRVLATANAPLTFKVWSRDPQRLKEKQAAVESKKEVKAMLAESRKLGFTQIKIESEQFSPITLKTETQTKTVPIDQAYREIAKTKTATSIEPVNRQPLKGDVLGEVLYKVSQIENKPGQTFGKYFTLGLVSFGASAKDYAGMIDATLYKQPIPPSGYYPDKSAPPEIFLSGVTIAAGKAITKRNWRYFTSGTGKAAGEAGNMTSEIGAEGTAGSVAAILFPFNPAAAARVVPIRGGAIPIATARGVRGYKYVISLGYDTRNIPVGGKYATGERFVGTPNPTKSGIENIRGATGGSFDVYELSGYSKYQMKYIKPIMAYAEKERIAKPGGLEVKMLEKEQREVRTQLDLKYVGKVPTNYLESLSPGIQSNPMVSSIAKAQKKGYLDPIKGSATVEFIENTLSRGKGDVDIEAQTLLKAEKGQKTILGTPVRADYKLERDGYNVAIRNLKTGESKKIVNIVTEREQVKNIEGLRLDNEKIYGSKWPNDKIKLGIEGEKEKLKAFGGKQFMSSKVKAASGIITKETLEEALNLTPRQRAEILGEYKMAFGGKGFRYEKDVVDVFMEVRRNAQIQFRAGNVKGALRSGETMRKMLGYYSGFDWGKSIRQYRPVLEVSTKTETPQGSRVSVASATAATKSAQLVAVQPSPLEPNEPAVSARSPYRSAFSPISAKSAVTSAISGRLSGKSALSARSGLSGRSTRSTMSGSSPDLSALSRKSTKSGRSARSPSSLSGTLSGRSGLTSGLSPSGRSPSTRSPTSPGSPNTTSPLSPKTISSISSLIISPLITPYEKIIIPRNLRVRVPFQKTTQRPKAKETESERADFLGFTRVEQIEGISKREDILYGKKRTAKEERIDVRLTRTKKGQKPFAPNRSSPLLERTRKGLLIADKKRGRFARRGGGRL